MRTGFGSTAIPLIAAIIVAVGVASSRSIRASQTSTSAPSSELTQLDAVITDTQGRPLLNLKPDDLELREDGIVYPIQTVEFKALARDGSPGNQRGIASALDEKEEAQRPDVRIVAVFLDEYHVSPANTARVREAMTELVETELRPEDLVVVMKPLDSLAAIRLTRDRAAFLDRAASFEGRLGDYEPRTTFEETLMSRAPGAADAARAQVVFSALRALTVHIGELRGGRKTLILVSEGFVRPARRDGQRVPDPQAIARAANALDVAIYTVNPQPDTPSADTATGQQGAPDSPSTPTAMLRMLAEQTGGSLVGAGNLNVGLRRAARDLDGYYQLTYQASHVVDGKRHALELRVKRPGTQVQVRTGHWTRQQDALRIASARSLSTTIPSVVRRPQQMSPLIRPWFGVSRGADGRTRLTFTWEPNQRMKPAANALTMSAVAADGTVLFQGRVDPIRTTGTVGSQSSAVFEAPPGTVQLDMTIRSIDGQQIGSDARDIDLPDMTGPRTRLSTPEILRARTAREFRLISGDPQAPPVVSREFSRAERLLVRVRAYAPQPERPVVTARLLSRLGQPLRELTPLPDEPANSVVQFDLPLASLGNGEYGIELVAQGPPAQVKELILFRVTN
ncbi:MAG TPA: VWA domain-containing protein [Vicinamibacterales bacterium]